uniref:hypothetical protein n=1 Tax=Cutleria multifida TaxID=74475 RepID=UPI002E78B135|nr:hypothetical protein V2479_pgp019 [Cutleria multifida]WAM62677.1 hypothetical protein [Cutleria multifida]
MDKNYKKSTESQSRWGFYSSNEILNGRLAMILLILIIIIETFTQKTLLNIISSLFF